MIYIVLFIVLLYGCIYFNDKNKVDKGNKYLYFEYILIVLVMGLRYKVGGDSLNYFYAFDSWPTLSEIGNFDFSTSKYNWGWIFFAAICKAIYDDFVVLQLIQAAIVNAAFFYFFKKNIDKYFMAIFLYGVMFMFTFNTELMRAAMAVSVFLFGFEIFKKKQWVKFYILCMIAFSFHSEAIVMFLLPICYPLSKLKINFRNLILLLLISLTTVSAFNLIPQLANFISISNQMSMMFAIYSQETIDSNMNGYIVQIFFIMPWFFFLWLSRKEQNVFWRGFIILYIFFAFQQLRYMVFMERACDMLYPLVIVAIVDSIKRVRTSRNAIHKMGMVVSIIIVIGLRINSFTNNKHWKLFYPYSSVIFPEENPEREILLFEFQNPDK